MVYVKDIKYQAADNHLAGFGVVEGLFFNKTSAGNSAPPIHLCLKEGFLPFWAGVKVVVLPPRVISAAGRIVADRKPKVVEVGGYKDF